VVVAGEVETVEVEVVVVVVVVFMVVADVVVEVAGLVAAVVEDDVAEEHDARTRETMIRQASVIQIAPFFMNTSIYYLIMLWQTHRLLLTLVSVKLAINYSWQPASNGVYKYSL
jgi:hypothetical protein